MRLSNDGIRIETNTVEPVLSDPLGRVTIRLDNRKAKITGLHGVGRVGLRSEN